MLIGLVACLVVPGVAPLDRPPPVAVIVEVHGQASRSDGKASRRVRRLDLLRPGDKVSAGPKGSVTVFFAADGHLEKFGPEATMTVTRTGGKATGGVERLPPTLSGANLEALRAMIRSGKIGGGTFRGNEPPRPAVAPVDGTIVVTDRPVLRWPAVAGATGYRVVLLSGTTGANEKEIQNQETKGTEWAYPADAPPLVRFRTYRWWVAAKTSDGREKRIIKESRFTVGSAEMEKQATALAELAKKETPVDLLVAILGFESLRLLDELYPLYTKLAKQIEDDANLWAKVAEYAARAGRPKEAAAALKKARELGWKPDAL
jgi:hypothetical protein